MADTKIPKGPGQQEVNGELKNPRDANPPGTYRDPESGVELEVTMSAGADALARMGWKHIRELGTTPAPSTPGPVDNTGESDEEEAPVATEADVQSEAEATKPEQEEPKATPAEKQKATAKK